jgi:hypothetical protein
MADSVLITISAGLMADQNHMTNHLLKLLPGSLSLPNGQIAVPLAAVYPTIPKPPAENRDDDDRNVLSFLLYITPPAGCEDYWDMLLRIHLGNGTEITRGILATGGMTYVPPSASGREQACLAVHNGSKAVMAAFEATPWAASYMDRILRIDGAFRGWLHWNGQGMVRCIMIPMGRIITLFSEAPQDAAQASEGQP